MVTSLLVGGLPVAAGPQGGLETPQATFRSGVEVVSVAVAVRDQRGRVVRDLTREDFEVLVDGEARKIRDFYAGESAISLAVLLDISGSMAVGGNMDRARDAVALAMKHLQSGEDEAALLTFDSVLEEVVPFTRDLDRIRHRSLEGTPWGQTSLFDAIAATAHAVAGRNNRHRAVLVVTDGVDTVSRLTAPEVSGIASSIDVPVYLMVVAHPIDHVGTAAAARPTEARVDSTASLADLARWTGGDMRIVSIPAHTVNAVRDLVAEMRHQYVMTFEPGDRPGWHRLEIRARKGGLIVHARSGFMSGPS